MKITVFDGATTIGGNKIYVEENGKGVFFDFGMNFARYSRYFAEFLNERSTRGIHDLLYLNLIPKLNIYRSDLIPSDLDMSIYPKLNVEAVLLSHAHVDHCGNISLLDESIPVMASPMTMAILKAMRDVSASGIGSEIAYFSCREPVGDGRVLSSIKSKFYKGRDFICTGGIPDELAKFMCYKPGQESKNARKKLNPGNICHVNDHNLSFDIDVYEVDHSIYGATAYILWGDSAIAYTGDIRMHGKYADRSKEFIKRAKGASVLIIEGTRASRNEDVNESEDTVFENCLKAVEESEGVVVADFSPRNFERLETFIEIAGRTSRELVVTAKDAYMLHAMECADGVRRIEDVRIYHELRDRKNKWEEIVVRGKWEDRYVDPSDISSNPENYILCFSFYDMKHLLDIKPDGGAYIYSSSEAFSEEQEFDFLRLYNWLQEFGLRVYGFEMVLDNGRLVPSFIRGFHASGHASKGDLRWVIEQIDPDVIIPVHTENSVWFEENFENVVVLKDGETIEVN
ncbi:putative hydrolase of the metallo-beta-lactamase superfamily [Archaeoglobus sulfaticallidus PM70-1]|uniref:Putative hydrolase of the metallo-beta-lactamase superfamily n=1 Tax=Archaeoglobus sulfaticallidus PM70-1 TaxID=387631 RepID=N0BE87_9EURY|nr:ribonuclease J [Archaeoglobus sulfaticallidus]AGK61333.1 putative hydrolase of the metallo-beta-lactamase superfamily [Archaeoglobus sulfaticallidus PM70-1]